MRPRTRVARQPDEPHRRQVRRPHRRPLRQRIALPYGQHPPQLRRAPQLHPRTGAAIVIHARSAPPAASAATQPRLEFSVWNSRLTCGYRSRNATTAADMKCRTVVAPVVTRTEPPSPRARSRSRRSAWSTPPMPSAAAPRSSSPACVGTTPRGCRSTRLRPTSRSSRLTCWLTADCVQPSSRATALRLPARQTATNTRRSSRVMRVKLTLGDVQEHPRIDLEGPPRPR